MVPFLQTVAHDVYDRLGDDLRQVAIVFNNKRPVVYFKKYLAERVEKPVWSPSFFTIQEFIGQSSNETVTDFMPAFFLLHEAYNELLIREAKEPIEYDAFFGLAETLVHDFDQIDYELVAPEAIFQYLSDVARIEQQFAALTAEQQYFLKSFWGSFSADRHAAVQQKFLELWNRLPDLYTRFRQKMKQHHQMSTAMQYRELAEGRAARPDFIDRYRQVAFVGFNALNQCERILFRTWQDQGKALFYFDGDQYYFEDPQQEAGLFLRQNMREYGLKNALGAFPALITAPKKNVSVYPVTGHVTQAKTLAKILADRSDPTPADVTTTAVILADETLLIPALQTIPDHFPLNVTMGFPLRQSSLNGFLDLWLSVQEQLIAEKGKSVSKESAISFWVHPLSGADQNVIAEKMQAINGLTTPAVPVALMNNDDEESTLFFQPVTSAPALLTRLQDLLQLIVARKEAGNTLHLIESSLIYAVHKVINQLQDGVKPFAADLPVTLMIRFVRKALSGLATPLEGEPLQGLQVMGMLESRCLDFEEVILLGVNEGVLPALSASATFIPESLRRAFGLPVMENQDALSAYLFYRLFQRAQKISIVYNVVTDHHNSGEPSRFLQQIQFETALPIKVFTQKQPILPPPSATIPLCMEKTSEVMSRLGRYLQEQGASKSLSASALKLYLQCPLQFFVKYLAGINEPKQVGDILDRQRIGTMLHQVLESFYAEFKGQTVTSSMIEKKQRYLSGLTLEIMSRSIYRAPGRIKKEHMDSMQQIAHRILLENARLILDHDRLQVAPFTILDLENDKDYYCLLPIRIGATTVHVRLHAIIDRVDRVAGTLRVVDYKSGGDQLNMKAVADLFDREKPGNPAAFQALFYALVCQKVHSGAQAIPHLYILRRLQTEGSALGTLRANRLHPFAEEEFPEMMETFENNLKMLLEELFTADVPFTHHPAGKHYADNPYALFCRVGSSVTG